MAFISDTEAANTSSENEGLLQYSYEIMSVGRCWEEKKHAEDNICLCVILCNNNRIIENIQQTKLCWPQYCRLVTVNQDVSLRSVCMHANYSRAAHLVVCVCERFWTHVAPDHFPTLLFVSYFPLLMSSLFCLLSPLPLHLLSAFIFAFCPY